MHIFLVNKQGIIHRLLVFSNPQLDHFQKGEIITRKDIISKGLDENPGAGWQVLLVTIELRNLKELQVNFTAINNFWKFYEIH